MVSVSATQDAFAVALGSSLKKNMVNKKVVVVATILQVMVLAICLFRLFIERGKNTPPYFSY